MAITNLALAAWLATLKKSVCATAGQEDNSKGKRNDKMMWGRKRRGGHASSAIVTFAPMAG